MGVKRDRAVEKVVRPFQAFADKASSGGILLITGLYCSPSTYKAGLRFCDLLHESSIRSTELSRL
jgi:hypothetical protein